MRIGNLISVKIFDDFFFDFVNWLNFMNDLDVGWRSLGRQLIDGNLRTPAKI